MKIDVPPGTYIVAVSGGVDSVVLLDMMAKMGMPLVVAHFDHGTRPDSADDAQFVAGLAKKYGLSYEVTREELGAGVSEARARRRRYAFLRHVAEKHQATIATAHHADDVIETIAINLTRGTGWRGLAVLDSPDIVRPLLRAAKAELLQYAREHGLDWHEDSTNQSDAYLRNRLRRKLAKLDDSARRQLLALRDQQIHLKNQVDQAAGSVLGEEPYSRYFFSMINDTAAMELLRLVCLRHADYSPLTAQLYRALLAVKTASAGARHDVGGGVALEFTKTNFIVKTS